MKKLLLFFIPLLALAASPNRFDDVIVRNTVSIGNYSTADSKALLDINSTAKGVLFPRMSTSQRDAISSPPVGLTIFNTSTNEFNHYNGSSWDRVVPNAISQLTGDVTAIGPGSTTATVAFVGGSSAAAVNTATIAANAATELNTPSTIVKRDSNGDFAAGNITATLTGNASTATTATNFTGSLSGDVTGTQSATTITDLARSKIAAGDAYYVIVNDSLGRLSGVSPGASGQVLTSNGTSWNSQALPAAGTQSLQNLYNVIIGSTGQVTDGIATHSTYASYSGTSIDGDRILVLPGYSTAEAWSVSKKLFIMGIGNSSTIDGAITFASGSSKSMIKDLRTTSNMTINSGVSAVQASGIWFSGTNTFIDNGDGNLLEGVQE